MGLRDGDGVVDEEEEESLSFAEGFSAADGDREIMSSLASRNEDALMLAKENLGSSMLLEIFVGAMTFYPGSCIY